MTDNAGTRKGRSYRQACGLALGLDLLGQRWVLLIVRELLHGPRRFKELETALRGIGPNLLSERLQELVDAGVIERQVTSPAARREHYSLTEVGEELRQALLELAGWGLRHATERVESSWAVSPSWAMFAVEAMVHDSTHIPAVDESYEFRIDDEIFHVDVAGGSAVVSPGPANDPALTIEATASVFVQIGTRHLDPLQAIDSGNVTIAGSLSSVVRCCALLDIPLTALEGSYQNV